MKETPPMHDELSDSAPRAAGSREIATTEQASPRQIEQARRLLQLANRDRRAAEAELAVLPLEHQVAVVCEAPVALRARMLELLPQPEAVIPMIPEAELCFTAKALGLGDASWLLEHASDNQLVACTDLDAWNGLVPEPDSISGWIRMLAEAGEATLLRTAQALDAELMVLMLRDRLVVMMDPKDEEWQAPEGAQTIDGQFYVMARKPKDDVASLMSLLRVVFQQDYWLYFRLVQACIWETESELEEWALRWRSGRLADLGFPSWDESMAIYGFLRPDKRSEIADAPVDLEMPGWNLPMWMPELPVPTSGKGDHSLFRAMRELPVERRTPLVYAFISLSNKIAVADRMPLGDAETLPTAIEKAATVASLGLDYVADKKRLGAGRGARTQHTRSPVPRRREHLG